MFSSGAPVHGGWGHWGMWSECSVNCGNGTEDRIRYCDNPSPKNGGNDCKGVSKESKRCSRPTCSGTSLASLGDNCLQYCENLGKVFFLLVSYVGERLWWPIQSLRKGEKKKAKG